MVVTLLQLCRDAPFIGTDVLSVLCIIRPIQRIPITFSATKIYRMLIYRLEQAAFRVDVVKLIKLKGAAYDIWFDLIDFFMNWLIC